MIDASSDLTEVEAVATVKTDDVVDGPLVEQLVGRAREQGVVLTGESGLLGQLTKRVLESALEGELTDYLGYDKYERVESATNARKGSSTKTVLTDIGPVPIEVARDWDCSFQPQIVRKHQRRLSGVDEMVLSLSARGLAHGEISAYLAEVYGAEVSKTTITTITDRVVDGMTEWQNRPMDPGQFRSTPSGGRRRELRWPISRRGTDYADPECVCAGQGGFGGSHYRHNSETVEECEQVVRCEVSAGWCVQGRSPVEGVLLHAHISVNVNFG